MIIEEVAQVPMVVLHLTTEAVTSTTPPQIERETTTTEKETVSTWIRETIKVEEAMITTTPHREAAATSLERAEAATTVI